MEDQMFVFIWDPDKNDMNYKKHKISFDEASSVFYDDKAVLFDDPDHSDNEERFLIIGMSSKANLLLVCHCYRKKGKIIRIISARKATKAEEKDYIDFQKGW